MSKGRRRWTLSSKRENLPILYLLVPSQPSMDQVIPTCTGESRYLYLVTEPKASNPFQKHSHRHTHRNNVFPAVWAFLRPAKLTHNLNHHTQDVLQPQNKVPANFCYLCVVPETREPICLLVLIALWPTSLIVCFPPSSDFGSMSLMKTHLFSLDHTKPPNFSFPFLVCCALNGPVHTAWLGKHQPALTKSDPRSTGAITHCILSYSFPSLSF